MNIPLFQTKRLLIRKARPNHEDIQLLTTLWNHPEVMKYVGFPKGLQISPEDVKGQVLRNEENPYSSFLIVEEKSDKIGQCCIGIPDDEDLHNIDFKLLPQYWRQGYGKELISGLAEWICKHSCAKGIKGTPHKKNIASQNLFEWIGCKKKGEDIYHFPETTNTFTCSVPHYIYTANKDEVRIKSALRGPVPKEEISTPSHSSI